MHFQSRHLRVTAEHGTATLRLGFPGDPPNALDLARLREFDAALAAVAAARPVRVLVVRSANPAGFCAGLRPAGLHHPADRAAFAWYGQQVFDRLARLDAVSVAVVDGPCLGAGLELALACDHRVCVARPTTHLGFPDRFACFGGSARLGRLLGRRAPDLVATGRTLSGREARASGLVDVACCERRGEIELRTFLDRLEGRPVKRWPPDDLTGLAAERRAFSERGGDTERGRGGEKTGAEPVSSSPPPSPHVGLVGDDPHAARVVAEAVLRGGWAVVCGGAGAVIGGIDRAAARGFVTPLEADRARGRVRAVDRPTAFDRAGLVFVSAGHDPTPLAAAVRPRTVLCVVDPARRLPPHRRTVRAAFDGDDRATLFPGPTTDPDAAAALAAWLRPLGVAAAVAADARPVSRAA